MCSCNQNKGVTQKSLNDNVGAPKIISVQNQKSNSKKTREELIAELRSRINLKNATR